MNKKKKALKIILLCLLGAAVVTMVALPFVLDKAIDATESKASILSVQAQQGEIKKTVSGAGTLTDSDAVTVTVPDGVQLTEYLVEEGQQVQQGDSLAKVDKVSVMETISLVQETLDYISQEMTDQSSASSTGTVTATNSGRVMAVYAKAGDSVREVMEQHGCLALVSLDGYLDLRIDNTAGLRTGDTVSILSSSGLSLEGKVEKVDNGKAVILIDDSKLTLGQSVEVFSAAGEALGSGEPAVHSPWRICCYSGTVKSVNLTEGKTLSKGTTIFKLDNTDTNAAFNVLAAERREYEDLMAELFTLYQDGAVKASTAGCVTGIDDTLVEALSFSGSEPVVEYLAAGDIDTNGLQIMQAGQQSLQQIVAAHPLQDPDTNPATAVLGYVLSVSGSTARVIYLDSALSAGDAKHPASFSPVTVNIPANEVYYWGKPAQTPGQDNSGGNGDTPGTGSGDQQPEVELEEGWQHTTLTAGMTYAFGINGDRTNPLWITRDESATASEGGGGETKPSGGFSGFGGGWGSTTEEEFEQYEIAPVELMEIVPLEELTVTITIDEADILSVKKGMEATVTLDAMPGRSFSGTVTEINTTGENSGGSTKYTATVTLPRQSNMLAGMNASCLLTVESFEDIITIPSEALVDQKGKTLVYTGYDEKAQQLINPVEVETGVSDGSLVQILSGLDKGDTVWYSYYDTLPESFAFGSFNLPDAPAGNAP